MKKGKIVVIIMATIIMTSVLVGFLFIYRKSNTNIMRENLNLGQRYLEEINYEQAIIAFEQAIEIDPMCIEANVGLADAYIGIGDNTSAIKVLEKVIDIDPMHMETYIKLADAYVSLEKYDKAILVLRQGYEITADNEIILKITDISHLIELNKENAEKNVGNISKIGEDSVWAEESYDKIEINPSIWFQNLTICGELVCEWNIDKLWQYAENNAYKKEVYSSGDGTTYDYWTNDGYMLSILDCSYYKEAHVVKFGDVTSKDVIEISCWYHEERAENYSFNRIDLYIENSIENSPYPSIENFFSTIDETNILYNLCIGEGNISKDEITYSGRTYSGSYQVPQAYYIDTRSGDIQNYVGEDYMVGVSIDGSVNALYYGKSAHSY